MSETAIVIRTSRPNFLVMAPLCVGLGVALAWRLPEAPPPFLDTLLVFIGALLAHAAVNMLNEYEDFTSGLDLHTRRTPFSGGSGALPQLPSAARSVLLGALVTLGLVVAIGLYFLSQRGLPMLILGGAGVALVITYTRWITRSPLLCLLAPGLGFGPVMVLGTLVALGAPINAAAVAVSVISLLLVSTLLLMNQIPDAEADRRGGRYHAVIVLGAIWLLNDYRGVPTPVLILAALLLAGLFMATRTAFGRRIYAIGGNLEAARLSGINVERTKLAVFAINGLMVAIAGLILSSRLGAGSPSAGNIAELDAIAACVIGGTSLAGGIGSVAGAVMGAFIMSALDNGMSMMDVATFWQYIVKGAILLLAVWMDSATKRRA